MYPSLSNQLTKKDVNKSDAILIARFYFETKLMISTSIFLKTPNSWHILKVSNLYGTRIASQIVGLGGAMTFHFGVFF